MSIYDAIIRVKSAFAIWEQGGNLVSYDSIHEACDMAVDALEKQSPKRVKMTLDTYFVCPICACKIDYPFGYCHNCGQAIDWGIKK